jgi:hypothetical protein
MFCSLVAQTAVISFFPGNFLRYIESYSVSDVTLVLDVPSA